MQKQTGEAPQELTDLLSVKCPELMAHVWLWFLELNSTRTNNGFSQNSVSFAEIECWARLNEITLNSFEVKAIRSVDDCYLSKMNKRKPSK